MSDLLKRIKRLEKRVEQLENKRPQGQRLKEIADWIMTQFDGKEKYIPVAKIMARGRKRGYSEQMISRARRTLLGDEIGHSMRKAGAWYWGLVD